MNLNKFTEKAQEAVLAAQNMASEASHAEITPEHLLVALIDQQGGIVPSILAKMNVEPRKALADAQALLKALPQVHGADVRLSPRMNLIVHSAPAEAS
jgi:ATP-dependent Clp protease ATP-binding subunit ClpB